MSLTPEELEKKIRSMRATEDKKSASHGKAKIDGKGTGMAMRASIELVSALVVGGFLGYLIDQWLGITPWGMIIFMLLGFVAGFMNIYRAATGQDLKIGFKKRQ
jgi:ATP synthase protein I